MIVDIVNGFLGSGKTTFIQHMVKQISPLERVVVLVNDFGVVGIDGVLLSGEGLDVVEMTSGCVCCTLAPDLSAQLLKIATRLKPDRVVIEPTGVASIQGLLSVVGGLRLEKHVEAVKVILLLDAADVLSFGENIPSFLRSQIARADVVIINKCDLVPFAAVREIKKAVSTANRCSVVIAAKFGQVAPDQMDAPPDSGGLASGGGGESSSLRRINKNKYSESIAAYQSFSREYPGMFDAKKIEHFFRGFSQLGIIRAKGVFHCAGVWSRIDYVPTSGVTVKELGEGHEKSRVLIIGRGLNSALLERNMQNCLVQP